MTDPQPRKPSEHDCRYSTCTFLGRDYSVSVVRWHDGYARTLHRITVPICNDHRDVLNDAKAENLMIYQTREGWLYVDTTAYVLTGEAGPGKLIEPSPKKSDRQPKNTQCPMRAAGLYHTRDTRIRPSGDCLHCGTPLSG